MKQGMLKSDWFVGLLIILAFLTTDAIFGLSDGIERSAYDFGVKSSSRIPSEKVSVIAIDDQSIANIGRWPWPRDVHSEMYNILTEGGAKVIGQTVFTLEPQIDPGLQYIRELRSAFEESNIAAVPMFVDELGTTIESARDLVKNKRDKNGRSALDLVSEHLNNSPLANEVSEELVGYMEFISAAEESLDTDRRLAEGMAANGNVVIAMPFIPGEPLGRPDDELPDFVRANRLPESNIIDGPNTNPDGFYPVNMVDAIVPVPIIGEQAAGIGSLAMLPDVDGGIRSESLVVNYYDDYYPSLSLLLAAKSLNLSVDDIRVTVSSDVQLGRLNIKTNQQSMMNTFFYTDEWGDAFPVDSFFDVLQGKIPPEKYKDQVVLIGATAYGVGDSMVTPIDPAMSPVLTLAHSVSSILNEDFFVEPAWASYAKWAALLLVAIYLMVALPKLGAAVGFAITAFLFIVLFLTNYISMTTQGMWIQLMMPAMLLVIGHLLLTTKNFLLTEKGKAKLDIESAVSNRQLGLSMQGQGQLDSAFDMFRKLPVDKDSLELMYNLALDFERKRQFNKAKSVYDYMSEHDANFRDIGDRSNRAKALEETVILGGAAAGSPGGTLVIDGSGVEKPKLGRYEVERELGKGAMGAVYLGKDPKISRVVAIKTMALSQEFEEDELQDVKDRFFREAETAGRLTHPAIVTMYDAGEEHDLAYIAMEFLKGSDLVKYTKKDNLLPFDKVLDLIKRSADGLDYAHQNNVVHRDIKPANIMYDAETDTMKLTDFGIARITDSSKTKTGMVLGTPSYMSPEQLAGKKVEGQSDLFSLGVMLFQMVTGQLPFKGDSMATLMYQIANEPHPDASTINSNIPRCVVTIIDRALEKDTEKRYKTGANMAEDIDKCLKIMAAEGNAG